MWTWESINGDDKAGKVRGPGGLTLVVFAMPHRTEAFWTLNGQQVSGEVLIPDAEHFEPLGIIFCNRCKHQTDLPGSACPSE